VESAEQLFAKIRNDFGKTSEEERKIEQLRIIEQAGRTCDEYVQEFKKVARRNGYEGRPLIEKFKRGLNGAIRRKLAEAEEPPSTIGEWQERVVRLDRNQRQSRAEKRMLERNVACPGGNAQPRGGLYGGRGGQIMQRWGDNGRGYRGGEIQATEEETNQVHRETRMQWTLIEKEGEIEHTITVESGAIWLGIVGKKIGQE